MQEVVESALKGNVHTAMQELDHKKVQYFGNPILENQKIQGIIILVTWILLNGSGQSGCEKNFRQMFHMN